MKINLADAKKQFPQLIKAAEEGEVVTICRNGNAVVDLVRTTMPSESKVISNRKPVGTLRGRSRNSIQTGGSQRSEMSMRLLTPLCLPAPRDAVAPAASQTHSTPRPQ